MILNKTTSYCRNCDTMHDALYRREGDKVIFEIDCPSQPKTQCVSSDAELFNSVRAQYHQSAPHRSNKQAAKKFFFIEITNACNMDCPICYAEAGSEGRYFMDLDTVRLLGERIRSYGGRWVSLSGGDPSMHPELAEIIRILKVELGLSPLIVTNGLRIASDPEWLQTLIDAGLEKVQLQFDTFNNATYQKMRGRTDLSEKFRAIDTICSAKLRLGLVTTVCQYNLHEVNEIVDYAAKLTPALNTLILQCMLPVGRFPSTSIVVDRESVVRQLARGGELFKASAEDFLPFPKFTPLGFEGHPDCEISAFFAVGKSAAKPISRNINVNRLYQMMGSYEHPLTKARANLALSKCLFKSSNSFGSFIDLMLRIQSLRRGCGYRRLFLVTVGSFMHPECRDEERLKSCISCNVILSGFESMCGRNISWSSDKENPIKEKP